MDSTLQAVRRDTVGKNEAVRLRQSGKIPAVLYGGDSKTGESVIVDPKDLSRILHSKGGVNSIIALTIDGAADTRVLVKEYQIDPVTHRLLHALLLFLGLYFAGYWFRDRRLLWVIAGITAIGVVLAPRCRAARWTSCTAMWRLRASRRTFPSTSRSTSRN